MSVPTIHDSVAIFIAAVVVPLEKGDMESTFFQGQQQDEAERRCFSWTISNADWAHSMPWLWLPASFEPRPARCSAWSSLRHAKTPNITGTFAGSKFNFIMPCVTASQMYSKCFVSPLMRHPRQMTTSTFWVWISWCAAKGNSYDPGTHSTTISSRRTPCRSNSSRHPSE